VVGTPFWKLVLKQFDDLLVKILIVAAAVDLLIALANGEGGAGAFVEPAVIVLILVANAAVGVVTETNAEKAIEELKAYEADFATALRDGRWTLLPASEASIFLGFFFLDSSVLLLVVSSMEVYFSPWSSFLSFFFSL
jgi:P-type Ca2+ transporter type 2A